MPDRRIEGRRNAIGCILPLVLAGGLIASIPSGPVMAQPGTGHLAIVLDATRLTITLNTLARDVTGLDHPPADAAETTRLADTLDTLRSGAKLFLLPPEAWCRPISATVATPTAGGSPDAALQASWQFQCSAPAALQWIDVRLLAAFPDLRKLGTSATTAAGIKSVVLTAGTPRILLPRQ